jgi:alpha-pyrone synthase
MLSTEKTRKRRTIVTTAQTAYINRIATATPTNDVHGLFLDFAKGMLRDPREGPLLDRLARKAQISHRYSVLAPSSVSPAAVYRKGRFPTTGERAILYERFAAPLAVEAVRKLELGKQASEVSHVVVTSCTGMYAPGLDLDLVAQCGLNPSVERTMVGFMGCYAAINGLKLAHHFVRSMPKSRVLVVNVELCSLHMQETDNLEQMLSFLIFGDGCAASIVSADAEGFGMDRFHAALIPETSKHITWNVRDQGFDMFLSSRVPNAISHGLQTTARAILNDATAGSIALWAVHPGGRAILDAVESGLELAPNALTASRTILDHFGNMSSATVMFVLEKLLATANSGDPGCAMSFGPGLTAETMLFHKA